MSSALKKLNTLIDPAGVAKLKAKYNRPEYDGYKRRKFLDLDQFLPRNLAHAERFGLLNSAPKRILDLGSGCGYFPFICRSFGHEVFCVDQPGIDIFDDVMDLLGLNRVDLTIRPKTPLGLPWRDIDLVTGLMVKFDAIDDRTRFGRSEWSYLIADLAGYLRGSARIYFEMNHLPVCPDIEADNREFFLGKGAKVTGPGLREILIADVEPFRPHA